MSTEDTTPAEVGSNDQLGPVAEALRLATTMMRDSWATGNDAAWQPAYRALEAHLHAMLAEERERMCAAIKAEDDYCTTEGCYMLDSDDCISVIRGTWVRPDYSLKA